MPANQISLEQAKKDKLFYFVANAVVYRKSDGRCLILKRHEREIAHGGMWATPGGKLEWEQLDVKNPTRVNGNVLDFEDAVEKLIVREVKEEAGIDIANKFLYLNSVAFVRPDGIPVVLVQFAVEYKSGEVVPEPGSFTDFAWVNAEEIKNYRCILGVDKEIEKAILIFGQ